MTEERIVLEKNLEDARALHNAVHTVLTWVDGFENGLQHTVLANKEPLKQLARDLEELIDTATGAYPLNDDDEPFGDLTLTEED